MKLIKNLQRQLKWFWQRKTRGFDDRDLWSLREPIAEFIIPRLKAFRDYTQSFPAGLSEVAWANKINTMIEAFEIISHDNFFDNPTDIERIRKGLNAFAEYYMDLWD